VGGKEIFNRDTLKYKNEEALFSYYTLNLIVRAPLITRCYTLYFYDHAFDNECVLDAHVKCQFRNDCTFMDMGKEVDQPF
jgi:hypothetical protein